MGSINTRAVRRSNALQGWAYGPRFRYREVMGFGSGPLAARAGRRGRRRRRRAGGRAVDRPLRALCSTACCPPPERARARASAAQASSASRSTRGPRAARATSAASRPKATPATRRRLSCSARAACASRSTRTGCLPRAGVLTPATAMGDVLIERLRARRADVRGRASRVARSAQQPRQPPVLQHAPLGLARAGSRRSRSPRSGPPPAWRRSAGTARPRGGGPAAASAACRGSAARRPARSARSRRRASRRSPSRRRSRLVLVEVGAALVRRELGLPQDLIDPRAPDAGDHVLVAQQRVQRPRRVEQLFQLPPARGSGHASGPSVASASSSSSSRRAAA